MVRRQLQPHAAPEQPPQNWLQQYAQDVNLYHPITSGITVGTAPQGVMSYSAANLVRQR